MTIFEPQQWFQYVSYEEATQFNGAFALCNLDIVMVGNLFVVKGVVASPYLSQLSLGEEHPGSI